MVRLTRLFVLAGWLGVVNVHTTVLQAQCKPWGAEQGAWHEVHKQTPLASGSAIQPSIRYAHGAVALGGQLIITLGYYFDRESTKTAWMPDTWAMQLSPPYHWRLISEGISQQAAHKAYSQGQRPAGPCGRFGHAVAAHGGRIFLYGGHDGGTSRHGQQNYEPGYDFDELWCFDPPTASWQLLSAGLAADLPGKRYLLAMAAAAGRLFIYGGLSEGQGDVWAYDISAESWKKLADELPLAHGGPGRRVGHSMLPVEGWTDNEVGFLLYGGRVVEAGKTSLDPSIWFFDGRPGGTWRRLGSTSALPPARLYHGAAQVYLPAPGAPNAVFLGVVVAGSTSTPSLTCGADSWAFTVDCGLTNVTWQRLGDLPFGIYDLRLAGDASRLFTTGGHLCSETKGGHPFYYSNAVHRLDIAAAITVPPTACRLLARPPEPPLMLPVEGGSTRQGSDDL